MRRFLQFFLIAGFIIAAVASISLMPMSFVAKNVTRKLAIKPISSSEYGYIDLLKMRYLVKNFVYFGKFDDFFVLLKSKTFGSGIFDSGKIQINDCKINIFTKKNGSEISDYIKSNFTKLTKNANLSIENCSISLKNIDESDYKKLENDKFNEEKVSNTQSNISLDLKDFNLESVNDNEIAQYDIRFTRGSDKVKLEYLKTKANENFNLSINNSLAVYKNDLISNDVKLDIDIKNSGNIFASLLCFDKSCERKFQQITSPLKISGKNSKSEITGKMSGLMTGDFVYSKSGLLKITGDINLTHDEKIAKQEDLGLQKKQISLYSVFQNFNTAKAFDVKISNITINQKTTDLRNIGILIGEDWSKNFSISTPNTEKIGVSGSYLNSEVGISINSFPFESVARVAKNLDIFDLDNGNSGSLSLMLGLKKGDWSWYLSRISLQDSNQNSSIDLSQAECLLGCEKNIALRNIDLSKIFDINELKKRYNLNKYLSEKPGVQGAMIYMKHDEVSGKDFDNSYSLTFENTELFGKKINSGVLKIVSSDNKKSVIFDGMDSDFLIGYAAADLTLKDGDKSSINILIDALQMKINDILEIFSSKESVKKINILLPSLVGFDGNLSMKIGYFSKTLSNIQLDGKLENGQLTVKNGKVAINGSDAIVNLSGSLSSKPIFDIGVGFEKAGISDLFGINFGGKIRGFYNASGSFQCEGFSIQELQNSLNGSLGGTIYNLEIDNFNLQGLSNKLLNIAQNKGSIKPLEVISSDAARFKSANATINYSEGVLKAVISNAKNKGSSLSGFCSVDYFSSDTKSCQFMASVVGLDLSSLKGFYNLQISNAISGNLSNPSIDWNLSQVDKYLSNAAIMTVKT